MSRQSPLMSLAGTNDMLKKSPQVIYSQIEAKLQILSKSRKVLITTIPFSMTETVSCSLMHCDISLANNYNLRRACFKNRLRKAY